MPRTDTTPRFGWRSFLTHLSSFTVLVLAAGLLVGASIGMKPLEARAAGAVASPAPCLDIQWPSLGQGKPGTWLPRDQQERLARVAADAAGPRPEPFSNAPLERVSTALGATGWFEQSPQVRRTGDGRIAIDGRWRVPAAVVRRAGREHMLAWDAKLIPPVYAAGQSRLPAIIDPAVGPPGGSTPDYATPWSGEDIAAALELLQTVLAEPWAAQVAGIDVSKYSAESSLALVTREGSRIVWGGRPSKPRLGEVSTKQKLLYLLQLHHDFGRIDAGYALIYVNSTRLQFDTSASAQPTPRPGTP